MPLAQHEVLERTDGWAEAMAQIEVSFGFLKDAELCLEIIVAG